MLKGFIDRLFGRSGLPETPSYAESRAALERHSVALKRDLAGRKGVAPEILYYLAEDPDPEIRRKAASNPSTPIQADRRLADDADEDVRAALARKIGRLAPHLTREKSAKVTALAMDILQRLAEDQAPRVRAILAREIKSWRDAPSDLIQRLARDAHADVASPILEYSSLLGDADLKEIIDLACVSEALSAIARRKNLSPSVCDAVIARMDVGATAALLANHAANISRQALERILDQAAEQTSWHAPLVNRPNLSARVVKRIAGFVSSILIERLAARPGLDAETADLLRKKAKTAIETGELENPAAGDAAEARVRAALAAGALDDHFVAGAAERGERETVILALAQLAGVPDGVARRIVNSRSARVVTALVWKAGLHMRVSVAIQASVMKLPAREMLLARGGTAFPQAAEEMATHLSLFGVAA